MKKPSIFALDGRLALVTGSSQGIGLALAGGLAEHGAKVIINGRNQAPVARASEILSAQGHTAFEAVFDVTDPEATRTAIDHIEAEIGGLDILVNNAGMQFRAPLEEFPHDKWRQLLDANISSAFYAAQAAAVFMIKRGRGKIINIASVQSELARPGIAPYAATKGAIRNLTRGMATDWARHGLQVNAIAPGYFKTPLNQALLDNPEFCDWLAKRTPAGRWGEVAEMIGAAVFLASDASSFVNGHTLYVDGGISISL